MHLEIKGGEGGGYSMYTFLCAARYLRVVGGVGGASNSYSIYRHYMNYIFLIHGTFNTLLHIFKTCITFVYLIHVIRAYF